MQIDCAAITTQQRQYWLQSVIAPRPVALVSTIDGRGNTNLAPFSFFNLFSADPPVVIFSPCRSLRTGEQKDTLLNLLEVPEAVINIVDESMVQQVNLCSSNYARGISEFVKAGFTEEPARHVKPPMVRESKVKLECAVMEIKSLGKNGGAGNLVICEVLHIHIHGGVLDAGGRLDPRRLRPVARLGADWYTSVAEENLFTVEKPSTAGIGMDVLPKHIRQSKVLTGNHLARLATVAVLPQLPERCTDERLGALHAYFKGRDKLEKIERYAMELIEEGRVEEAWQALLSAHAHNLVG